MPGIFGVIDTTPLRSEAHQRDLASIAERMSAAMCYDGSYVEDLVSNPALGVWGGRVGFSNDAARVRWSAGPENLVIVTTGEPASDSGDANCVHDSNARTVGSGAHAVMQAYQGSCGNDIKFLAGSVAGFLFDRQRARCLVFSDRYGMERLFVHTDGPRTYFASEAKAILAVAPGTRAFDPTGLAELLACGCTLGKQSLFRDIEVLEGGTVLILEGRTVTRRRYFERARLEQLELVSSQTFLDGFAESLASAVSASVHESSKVAISLTGGLDSRMIMASLDAPQGSVPCYTFGSLYRTTLDVSIGRRVAQYCGQPHHVIELGNGFLTGIEQNLRQSVYISDGYIGLSGAAELYVNRLARSIAPCRVTGNWGGELMRGVRAFKHVIPTGNFIRQSLLEHMRESAMCFASPRSSHPLSFTLFYQMPMQGFGRYAVERSQVRMRSPFLTHEVVQWLYRAPRFTRESIDCALAVIRRRPELIALSTDNGRLGTDAAVMRVARRMYRRAIAKAEFLTSHGAPHWIAALSACLPGGVIETRFLGRDKFQHFRLWIRNELADFVRETLVHDENHGMDSWFDMAKVSVMVQDHILGRRNYTDEIDKLLTIAMAHRTLLTRFS